MCHLKIRQCSALLDIYLHLHIFKTNRKGCRKWMVRDVLSQNPAAARLLLLAQKQHVVPTTQHFSALCYIPCDQDGKGNSAAEKCFRLEEKKQSASIAPLLLHLQKCQKRFMQLKSNKHIQGNVNDFKISCNK